MRRAARIDSTANTLTAYAESLGFTYCPINGVIDGLLAWGQTVTAVDWKSKGGTLTEAQVKLIAKGFPVRFLSTPEQIDQLRDEMRQRVA